MSVVSGSRVALHALAGRWGHAPTTEPRGAGTPRESTESGPEPREELAQLLYLSEQGFWGSRLPGGPAEGTPWGTGTERFLRDRYLGLADAALAAGYQRIPACTREEIELAQRDGGATADPDEWILVAWALGIEVSAGG